MNKREKLNVVLDRVKTVPTEYIQRSLYRDINEMIMLCDNIIENNVKNVIEIGTYWGVASAVFASIIDGDVYTINVSDDEIFRSKTLWDSLDIKNIIQIKGSSLDELPKLVNKIPDVGFVYVDGSHEIPFAMKEFEIIKNSKIKNGNCLVYFDDGPLAGVQQAIKTHNLKILDGGHDWMIEDQKNKNANATLRAYHIFGDFKFE